MGSLRRTAAELILERADPAKTNMGLTSWSGDRVRKADAATAKNYLTEAEARELDLLVSAFLDLAADRARRRRQTTMAEWRDFLGQYLKLAEREALTHAGRVSHDAMLKIVDQRYAEFDTTRKRAEAQAAETEHEREVEAELRRIEAEVIEVKKRATAPAKNAGVRKAGNP